MMTKRKVSENVLQDNEFARCLGREWSVQSLSQVFWKTECLLVLIGIMVHIKLRWTRLCLRMDELESKGQSPRLRKDVG